MDKRIAHCLRLAAAIGCLSFAAVASARELAWSYVDAGRRVDAAITADGDTIALTSTATAHAIVRITRDGTVAWRRELAGAAQASVLRTVDWSTEHQPAGTRLAADRACFTYFRGADAGRTVEARCVRIADDRLALEYRFDDGADAAGLAGVSGAQSLQKLGGCPAP